jgi:hypothetical protein
MTFTGTSWIALRRPDIGWSNPFIASAREASTTTPRCLGVQAIEKRCHWRPRSGSSSVCRHVAASPVRTWTLRTPPSAQAEPHISRLAGSAIASWNRRDDE